MTYNPYEQSTYTYGQGSASITPGATVTSSTVPTVAGYAPGTTQSTITNPGPGVQTNTSNANTSNTNILTNLLNGLKGSLQSLSTYLTQIKTGSYGVGGSSGGSSGGTSQSLSFSPSPFPSPSPSPSPNPPPSFTVSPSSGLSNELILPDEKKKLNENQAGLVNSIGQQIATRGNLWQTIKNSLSTPSVTGDLSTSISTSRGLPFLQDLTTGISPRKSLVAGVVDIGHSTNPNNQISLKVGNINGTGGISGMGSSGGSSGGDNSSGGSFSSGFGSNSGGGSSWGDNSSGGGNPGGGNPGGNSSSVIDTYNKQYAQTLADLQKKLLSLKDSLDQFKKDQNDPNANNPDKWLGDAINYAKLIIPQYNDLSTQISEIDKVLMEAMAGFRKTAEDIRNNPDLTIWQQQRRLRELDDLQNYAPIFNGLSYKDLVAYRGQLAESLNQYATQYNNIVDKYIQLSDTRLPYQKTNDELQATLNNLNISSKLADLQKQLSYTTKYEDIGPDDNGNWYRVYTTVDAFGNPIKRWSVLLGKYGKSQQTTGLSALLGGDNTSNGLSWENLPM
ncbi:MAG: hypothetical protein QW076_00360 [Candidatus Anstonellales archaeon]